MSDWTVVLSSDDAKQVVLYNAKEKQLAVKTATSPNLSALTICGDDLGICAMCKRPFTPYVYRNYFQVLAEAFDAHVNKKPERSSKNIPTKAMNTGYYQQFFADLGRLGRGGGGAVFACEHVLNGTVLGRYAVKKVPVGDDIEWLTRLLHEVHMLEAGRHENVIEYKHAWLEEWQSSPFAPTVPHLFILMELAEEGSLEDLMKNDGQCEVLTLFKQISKGLAHLHDRGILHRDLKPSNILLKRDRRTNALTPMISDFGVASVVGGGKTNGRTGATGTIEYLAPELLLTDANGRYLHRHSTSSDIWSLGMIFYHVLFKTLPFSDVDDYDKLHDELISISIVPIPAAPTVSPPLRSLLRVMLNVNPMERPSIKAVLDVLSAIKPDERLDRMLPPSFTPVSLDRPSSQVSSSRSVTGSGVLLSSIDWMLSYPRLFHSSPILWALLEYMKCYPNAINARLFFVDLVLFSLAFSRHSVLFTILIGFIQSLLHMWWGPAACAS